MDTTNYYFLFFNFKFTVIQLMVLTTRYLLFPFLLRYICPIWNGNRCIGILVKNRKLHSHLESGDPSLFFPVWRSLRVLVYTAHRRISRHGCFCTWGNGLPNNYHKEIYWKRDSKTPPPKQWQGVCLFFSSCEVSILDTVQCFPKSKNQFFLVFHDNGMSWWWIFNFEVSNLFGYLLFFLRVIVYPK